MTDKGKVYLVLAGLAVSGVFVMLAATRFGVGVSADSTIYIDAARNLRDGHGLVVISGASVELKPLNHYPPFYPALLALASACGATVEAAARWLNAILFGVNIFLVGLSILCFARTSFWLPVTGAFLTLTAPDLLANHSVAMTEPLYLALTLGALLSLGSYLQKQRRRFLVLGAILMALSILTRYVGVAGVVTGSVALLFLDRNQSEGDDFRSCFRSEALRRRVLDTLVFVAVSCAPIALWSIRNRLATGGTSDRHLAFHPVKFQQIVSAFSTAAQWLLIGKVRPDVRFLAFIIEVIVMTCLTIYLLKRRGRSESDGAAAQTKLPHVLVIFVIFYFGLLILTITFFETDNVLDSRSLLPVHFALLVLAPCLANLLYARVPTSASMRIVLLVLVLLLAGSYTFRGARWLGAQTDGQGYASHTWKESPTMAQLRKLPAETLIYSNGIDAIYYLTGKRSRDIPAKIIHGTALPNPRYEAGLQEMSDDLRQHHGVLVYFNTLPERWFLPLEADLKSQLPLTELVAEPDGSIYYLAGR